MKILLIVFFYLSAISVMAQETGYQCGINKKLDVIASEIEYAHVLCQDGCISTKFYYYKLNDKIIRSKVFFSTVSKAYYSKIAAKQDLVEKCISLVPKIQKLKNNYHNFSHTSGENIVPVIAQNEAFFIGRMLDSRDGNAQLINDEIDRIEYNAEFCAELINTHSICEGFKVPKDSNP